MIPCSIIAWITDSDVKELASMNNIPEPYSLNVGQVLNIGNRQVNTGTNTNVNTSVINQSSSAGVQTAHTKPTNNGAMGPLITKPTTTQPKATTPPPTNTNTTTSATPAPTASTGSGFGLLKVRSSKATQVLLVAIKASISVVQNTNCCNSCG